jgi:hypothetical protein
MTREILVGLWVPAFFAAAGCSKDGPIRARINSGDAPEWFAYNFNHSEFINYAEEYSALIVARAASKPTGKMGSQKDAHYPAGSRSA